MNTQTLRERFEKDYCPDPEMFPLFMGINSDGEYEQALTRFAFIQWSKGYQSGAENRQADVQPQADKVPGVLRCGKCNFQLNKVSLCMNTGSVGAGSNATEPCPNGCGNLWQVSWKQWAEEHAASAERFFLEAQELKRKLEDNQCVVELPKIIEVKDQKYPYDTPCLYYSANEVIAAIEASGGIQYIWQG